MESRINFLNDFKTGEVFDFLRIHEILETLPEGLLKARLIEDLTKSERTLIRILRNTSSRITKTLKESNKENFKEVYTLNIGPDGKGLDSLSLFFSFSFFDGKEEQRDLTGGVIFHGCHKIFNEDLTLKSGIDFSDSSLCSISTHT